MGINGSNEADQNATNANIQGTNTKVAEFALA